MTTRMRALRVAIYAAVPLLALAIAYFATRGRGGTAAAPTNHQHDNAGAGSQIISLSGEQERRIGVTFAVATVGALEHRVRTVGEALDALFQ